MSLLLELVDRKIIRILTALTQKSGEQFHIQKLASEAKVPLSSTHRIVNKLVKLNLVEITTIGKFKIYQINSERSAELQSLGGGKK